MGRVSITTLDADGDRATTSIPVADALSDGTDYATWRAAAVTLSDAVVGVQRTAADIVRFTADEDDRNATAPTNPDAQSTDVWVVEFSVDGMSGGPYSLTIPGADRAAGVIRNGRVELDIASGVGLTLKDAFEASYVWPGSLDTAGTGAATVQAVYVRRT